MFPPYARGAVLALSMDLVRAMAFGGEGVRVPGGMRVEDVTYGYLLFQLAVVKKEVSVTILDGDDDRFAMDPVCCTGKIHK